MELVVSTPPANLKKLKDRLDQSVRTVLKPRPRITGAEWSNKNRVLSAETATEPGQYDWRRAPFQKDILDVCCDSTTQRVVLMTAARVGKTTVLENVTGFFMDNDPAPIMWVLPDLGEAQKFSQTNLDPMIRDTRSLRELVGDKRTRDSGNYILTKRYKGGHISLVGAQSANALHGKTIRVLIADEVDRFPFSAGKDGDPLQLAIVRTTTFQNRRKVILSSTPVYKDLSHIEAEFFKSDQRYYHVPCPHCGVFQRLVWKGLNYSDSPSSPVYVCEACNAGIEEKYKFQMLMNGEWVKSNPNNTTAGFHLNALYSVHMSWKELVEEWQDAKSNRFKLQVFINSRLGETWDESGDRVTHHQLSQRLEQYNAPVPTKDENCSGVGILSAATDIQQNRIEVAVWGYGAADECWLIDTRIFDGDTSTNDVWNQCGRFLLTQQYKTKNGGPVGIRCITVDSGYNTERVYRFVQHLKKTDSAGRLILATKGVENYPRVVSDKAQQSKKYNALYYSIGTTVSKDYLSSLFNNEQPGSSYVHLPLSFPSDDDQPRFLDSEILKQLTAEKPVVSYSGNKPKREWRKIRDRNEQWDLMILAYAGLMALGPKILQDLPTLVEKVAALGAVDQPDPSTPQKPTSKVTTTPFKVHPSRSGIARSNNSIWSR